MGKILLAIIVIMVIIAVVAKFKTFFITLAVLSFIAFIVAKLYKKKKADAATNHDLAPAIRLVTEQVPTSAAEPVTEQIPMPAAKSVAEQVLTPAAKPIIEPQKPETVVNHYEVAGVVFYLKNLLPMMEPNYLWDYKKQDLIDTCNYDEPIYKTTLSDCYLSLSPEPDNPHDPNAIMVLLNDRLVGYIAAKDCKHVLDVIDNDLMVSMTCKVHGGKYKMLCEDYDSYRDKSTYSMEHGEDEYGITIYIREKVAK